MFSSTARTSLKRVSTRIPKAASASLVNLSSRCPRRHYSAVLEQAEEPAPEPLTNLRSNPYTFTPDTSFQESQNGTAVSKYNQKIYTSYRRRAVAECFELAAEMKSKGVEPNTETYNHLLTAASHGAMGIDCFAIFRDMLAAGVQPDITTFNTMFKVTEDIRQHSFLSNLMVAQRVKPTNETFEILVETCLEDNSVEMAIQYIRDMQSRGMEPTLVTMESTIKLVAQIGHSQLALDLAKEFEANSIRTLGPDVWIACLESATEALWADGVTECWTRVVDKFAIQITEGLCLAVLRTAARAALPQLAASAIGQLSSGHITVKEHHFIPFISALAQGNGIKPAIQALAYLRPYGIEPSAAIAEPISKMLSTDVDTLDSVWAYLDEMVEAKETVEVVVLNAIIQAAVALKDVPRAMGAFQSFADYNVVPTRDTFRYLMQGAIASCHRSLGDVIVSKMKEAGISADETTYEQIISLCLTQEEYLDAFTYLEEMKAVPFVPPPRIYTAIARKCAKHGDTRWQMVLEEMREIGYPVKRTLSLEIERYMDLAQNP